MIRKQPVYFACGLYGAFTAHTRNSISLFIDSLKHFLHSVQYTHLLLLNVLIREGVSMSVYIKKKKKIHFLLPCQMFPN